MARGVALVPPGGGELVGDSPDRRVEILSDHASLNATWSRFGPGREGADLHVHRSHTDLFYVLEGELTLRLGVEDEAVRVPAGTLVRVPPLVVHGFRNGSDREVRYLNFHAPGCEFAEYMRAMRDGRDFSYDQHPPPPDGGRPVSEAAIGEARHVGEAIAIAEVTAATEIAGDSVESFYVLEGELTVAADGRELTASAGSWAQVDLGTEATVTPAGAGARFLHLRTPG